MLTAQLRRYLRQAARIIAGLVGLLVVGLVVGAAYQVVAGDVDRLRYTPPGRLVDIGGRALHLYCTGQGSPTVILEAGLGFGMDAWRHVQPSVSEMTQVCSYDRAGYGWSDPGPLPRTSASVASDLHLLLEKAGIRAPLVLVGHSLGGLYVRYYAAAYPTEVSGMVLVESSHEDQGVPPRLVLLAGKVLAAAGVRRLLFQFGDSAKNAMYLSNNTNAVAYDELAAVDRTVEEVRAARLWLGTRPLIVITAGRNDGDQSWHRLQVDLLSHSSNSKRIVAQGSGHRVQDDRPDVVIAAIRDLIKGSRRLTRIPLGRRGEVTP